MGAYDNDGLYFHNGYQYITTGATSQQGAALDKNTIAVTLLAETQPCSVAIGPDPTAAVPSAEVVRIAGLSLVVGQPITVAVPRGSDVAPIKVAAIQIGSAGTLHIYERKLV